MQRGIAPEYMAIFEDNDPRKRMLAIIDNADVGELIGYSDEGFNPVPANEAYELWVNCFIYALTH